MATKTLDAAIAARKKVTDGAYVPIMQTDGTLAQIAMADLAKVAGGLKDLPQCGNNPVYIHINLTANQSSCFLLTNGNGSFPGVFYFLTNKQSRILDNGMKIYKTGTTKDYYIGELSAYGTASAYLRNSSIEYLSKEQFEAIENKSLVQ